MKSEGRNPKSEGNPKTEPRKIWVCFAVKEEAGAFQRRVKGRRDVRVMLVGMGKRNAERAMRAALAQERPGLVLSCGFAGGLRPDWPMGTVVFSADAETGLEPALLAAGARRGRFHCADRVAATAAEKRTLREVTGADAVEMESESICAVCREHGIPCAGVRVVLDTAEEDLPLDFNRLLTAEQKMSYGKLVVALAKSPGTVLDVISLQRQARAAARRLAEVLAKLIAA